MNNLKTFQDFVNSELNPEQQAVVRPQNGSFLVIAGAGSGKTRVITARIMNLILEHNVDPSSIMALTFTNKAAHEMQDRIEKFLPSSKEKPIIATFHSYCLRLLKTYRHLLTKETFSILDSQDQQKLLQNIIKEHGTSSTFNVKQLASYFSSFKMSNLLKIEVDIAVPDHHFAQFLTLYNDYEKQKQLHNYFDFDDLLYKTYQLFDTNQLFQQQHSNRYRHILIDEYQDTNLIQHELLKKMTLSNKTMIVDSICAVGDEDQSIYSWRGATIQNILDFNKEFPFTKTIKLEQNYRSSQRILDIANQVISNNTQRNHKKLWSDKQQHHNPLQIECLSDLQEAHVLVQAINTIKKTDSLHEIAILYRTHYQSRIIEEALIKEAIPYKMIGGIQFYERKEIKDLLAYLRLITNPFDKLSFSRIINCPLRGLGEKFEEHFITTWNKNPLSTFIEIAKKIIIEKEGLSKQITALQGFINLFDNLSETSQPVTALESFIKKTNYIGYLEEHFDKQEALIKKENIIEFLRAAQYAQQVHQMTLSSFLEDIALMQEQMTKKNDADCIQMMTLHSAKGLEFGTVFLSGLEDGIIPSNQSIESGNIEEERRLFYVGITRAKQKLLLTHSKHRNSFGQITIQRPSRFLEEISPSLIQKEESKYWTKSQFSTFFNQWNQPTKLSARPSSAKINFDKNSQANYSHSPHKSLPQFKKLQSVKHSIFGIGIIQSIEEKGNKNYVTVHFQNYGKKKIDGSFLTII
ncbi:UvrD-helicase domain-containing protein [Candidatus Dependentiae bacterium]|nr:UvrD-helicase domain-containing protein [Candidatus Dependentiae bacterium]